MSGNATPPKRHDPLRRLRDLFTHPSATHINTTYHGSSALTPASNAIPSRPKPQSPSLTQSSSCQSLQLGTGHGPASPADQTAPSVQPSTPSLGTLSQDFLDRVLQQLPRRERATIENVLPTTNDIDSALRQALGAAEDKQRTCQKKRWTFTLGGHTVTLQEKADNIVRWLDKFKNLGDVVVNVDPIHAGLPWVGIRLLLEVRVEDECSLPHLNFLAAF
jgi:hypothetical protein